MVLPLILAFLLGAVVTGFAAVIVARRSMITVETSRLGFEETVAALEAGVEAAEGWSTPGTRDLNSMMANHGVEFGPRVRLVEMCKARYAAEVLRDDRRVATLMPCAAAVWENDAGGVRVSRLNLGLMGPLFGGTVGRVMGKQMVREEPEIFGAIR